MKPIRTILRGIAVACAATALATGTARLAAAEVSFEGETVEIMVNFAAGSGTDTAARLVAPFIAQHLPGNPTIIVTNKAGAGGTAAVDYLIDSVPPDGKHIGYFAGTILRWALGMQQVPKRTGDLPFVASRSVNQIFAVRVDAELTADTMAGYAEPAYMALNSPDNHVAIRARLLANAIGMKDFKLITGYTTQGKMVAAARAGETELAQMNDSYFGANRDAVEGDGVLAALGQMGEYKDGAIVPQKGLEDIPVFDEIWRKAAPDSLGSPEYKAWRAIHIAMSLQNSFVLPPDTPKEYEPVWGEAVVAAYNDPDYLKQLSDAGVPAPASAGLEEVEESKAQLKDLLSDPEVRKAIEAVIRQNQE